MKRLHPLHDYKSFIKQVTIILTILIAFIINGYSQSPLNLSSTSQDESQIGTTYYDLQSNNLLQNRIYRYEDGSIGVVWTCGVDDAPNFPDRGTGYNFFDGSSWDPICSSRLESFRAGWPSYAPFGQSGEIICSHDYATGELYMLTRANKGTGTWTETVYSYSSGPPMLACPRVMVAGNDNQTIHLLANSFDPYAGQDCALLYSRSVDGGTTWDIQNQILDSTGSDYYYRISPDQYVWAEERAGVIAFLSASNQHDMFIMKSSDDGVNWEKTIIWEHPYSMFSASTVTDTFFSVDNSASIALDLQGKVHVVFGITKLFKESVGPDWYWNYWPEVDGIGYWNEDMETFSNDLHALAPPNLGYANSEMIEDYNYIGWMQDVNGNGKLDLGGEWRWYREQGASTMPTITIDESNNIYVLYSSATETFEYLEMNLRHIWIRAKINGNWESFVDLTNSVNHIFDECIYPVLASSSSDGQLHYFYQTDTEPGLAADNHHSHHENIIYYGKTDIYTRIEDNSINELPVNIYPNPTQSSITIELPTQPSKNTSLTISNTNGLQLITQPITEPQTEIDISHLPVGIYIVKVWNDKEVMVRKVIKQ